MSAIFRPKTWWPGDSTIMITSTLDRAVLGKAGKKYVVGSADLATTWTFKTARKLIAKVDGAKVNMRVWIDGEKVKTFPVSLGKDEWETRNGVKVISTQKEAQKTYRSTSLGLGPEEELSALHLDDSGHGLRDGPDATHRVMDAKFLFEVADQRIHRRHAERVTADEQGME